MEVIAKIKIMPSNPDADLKKLKENVKAATPRDAKLREMGEEPIAFGLKAIIAVVTVGDAEGGTERVEGAFAKVKGVESVQVISLDRI
ncbi:MAG: elongation factor 1-beta [Methanocellales archaeon]|nr:elongation factor 1-beta [Methanocellales archaeon]